LDVLGAVEYIAWEEKITGEDLLILYTAALYHDAGFLELYHNNEAIAVLLAEKTLPQFGYKPNQIQMISDIILATTIPQHPHTHLEEIICDADLDYLGRDDFFSIAETLKKEWLTYQVIDSENQWMGIQSKFLEQHKYFTKTAIQHRALKKYQHLETIKSQMRGFEK
jgi:predicted metal-dependent HD superfamily phosphohydrolase